MPLISALAARRQYDAGLRAISWAERSGLVGVSLCMMAKPANDGL